MVMTAAEAIETNITLRRPNPSDKTAAHMMATASKRGRERQGAASFRPG